MKNVLLSILVIATITISSCGESVAQEAEATQGKVELLSPTAFKEKLIELKDYQLIDVRTSAEVAKGAIEGALNIDFNSGEFKVKIAKLDKTKPTLVYCAGGYRSAKAASQMSEMGFVYVIDLDGGFGAWE
ncbi:MAG: rhodanese-like domain-containing protein [Flavobacteriales bacterium]|nr:rhodanese-like domain-containing protein [Flavobacteriales bacterium]